MQVRSRSFVTPPTQIVCLHPPALDPLIGYHQLDEYACLAWFASCADWVFMAYQPSYALLFSGLLPAFDVLALGFAAVGTAGVAYCTLLRRLP